VGIQRKIIRVGVEMKTTRYYHDSKKTVSATEGYVEENGGFTYAGHFGPCTIYKGYHFATEQEAALDLIEEIYIQIEALKIRQAEIQKTYLEKNNGTN
jgi:hypothetical protein